MGQLISRILLILILTLGFTSPSTLALANVQKAPAKQSILTKCRQWVSRLWAQPHQTLETKGLFTIYKGDFAKVRNVLVTGPDLHPLSANLRALNLENMDLKGKRILSVGEGYGALLPYLIEQGAQAQALDLWYDTSEFPNNRTGKFMKDFIDRYKPFLIAGDARRPQIDEKTYDMILSYCLVNNFTYEASVDVVRESLRMLKPGGQARIFGFPQRHREELKRFLASYGKDLSFELTPIYQSFTSEYGEMSQGGILLTVTRLGENLSPRDYIPGPLPAKKTLPNQGFVIRM